MRQPILIVDDDAGFRDLLATVLEQAGFATRGAATGAEALAAAAEEPLLAALLDVVLPDISGHEVLWQLRERFGNSFPIVYISGERTESADRAAGLMLGADDYVVKPFAPDELVGRVRRLVRNRVVRPAAAALTSREHEILCALARGLREAEIAAELTITPSTVATHIQRVLGKLDVHSRAQAVAFAYEHGLCDDAFGSPQRRRAAALPPVA